MNQGIHLTLLMGIGVPTPVPKPVIEALESVEVRHATDQPSGFDLKFKVSNKSPLLTLLTLMAQQGPLIRTIIVVTHNGRPHVLMDGVIASQELKPNIQTGQSVLHLKGEDLTSVLDLIKIKGKSYPGMPPSARVLMILGQYFQYGIIPVIIPSLVPDVPIPTEKIPSQNGTDKEYIKELGEQVGHVFFIDPGPVPGTNTAYWGPDNHLGTGPPLPALSVNMDAHTNVDSLSAAFNGSQKTLPILNIFIKEAKTTIPIPLPDISPLNPPLGLLPIPPKKIDFLKTGKDNPAQAALKGISAAVKSSNVLTISGSLDVMRYGSIMKARRLIGLRGAGLTLDGMYFVKSVTHSLKKGEFKQNFELVRNALVSNTPIVPV